jgi:hypothetical protein
MSVIEELLSRDTIEAVLSRTKIADIIDRSRPTITASVDSTVLDVLKVFIIFESSFHSQILSTNKILSVPIQTEKTGVYRGFVDMMDILAYGILFHILLTSSNDSLS